MDKLRPLFRTKITKVKEAQSRFEPRALGRRAKILVRFIIRISDYFIDTT